MAITNRSVVIPVEYSREIIAGILGASKALELGRRLPDMKGNTYKLNVLSSLPVANWVSKTQTQPNEEGKEINRKSLTQLAWEGKDVVAEEIACIVPIAINTLSDVENFGVEIVPTITNEVVGAFQKVIDETILFGVNNPFTGLTGVVPATVSAGASVSWNGNGATFYDAVSDAMSLVEASGYVPNAILGAPSLRGAFRKMRTTDGQQILGGEIVDDLARHYDLTGGFVTSTAFAIVGDFTQLVYSMREEMRMSVLEEATLVDPNTGTTLYNLAQQDMIALRFVMRLGYQIPNPINRVGSASETAGDVTSAFPFAVITKTA